MDFGGLNIKVCGFEFTDLWFRLFDFKVLTCGVSTAWVLVFGVWGAPSKHAKGYPFAVLANRKAADYIRFTDGVKRAYRFR